MSRPGDRILASVRRPRRPRFRFWTGVCDRTSAFLYWIAGADERKTKGHRKERFFFQLMGFSVILTASAAVMGMILFLRLSVPGPWMRDIAFGLFWGLFIFWLDRWLVARLAYGPLDATNTGREPKGFGRFIGYFARMLLGLFLAFTISGPIVLALFEPEVNQQVIVNQNNDKSAAGDQIRNRADFVKRRDEINGRVTAAQQVATAATAAREKAQKDVDDEVSGRGGTGVPGCASECRQKKAVLATAQDDEKRALADQAATQAQATKDTSALEADIAAATGQSATGIAGGTGIIARERALYDLLLAHPPLFLRWGSITGLLLLVDMMPILLKLLSTGSNTQMLHDRFVRLDAAEAAIQSDRNRITQRLRDETEAELDRERIREHKKLVLEDIGIDREITQAKIVNKSRVSKRRTELELVRDLEMVELEHERRLLEIQGRHARAMAAAQAQFGVLPSSGPLSRVAVETGPPQHAEQPFADIGSPRWVNDRWVLEQPLLHADAGATGMVHLARDGRDPESEERFVVKLLRSFSEGARRQRADQQLQNEQRWAQRVNSHFVAPIMDAGDDVQFGPFLVTPYYASTVARTLRSSDFTPTLEWALRMAEQTLRGLVDSYNKAGVVHLDIKPANIALDAYGDVHLLDFGLARVLAATASTPTGPPEGTRWYAPPEQLRGKDRHWPSSECDVRGVAAVLYEIITGWPPLYREAVAQGMIDRTGAEVPARATELWELLVNGVPVAPHELHPKLPKVVSEFVMRGLLHNPAERAPGASKLAAENALEDLLFVQDKVRRSDLLELGSRHCRRDLPPEHQVDPRARGDQPDTGRMPPAPSVPTSYEDGRREDR